MFSSIERVKLVEMEQENLNRMSFREGSLKYHKKEIAYGSALLAWSLLRGNKALHKF